MSPQKRKKPKLEPAATDIPQIESSDSAIHPDLAQQSSAPPEVDPMVLHPDLAAASAVIAPTPQPVEFTVMPTAPRSSKSKLPSKPRKPRRKAVTNNDPTISMAQTQPQQQMEPQPIEIRQEPVAVPIEGGDQKDTAVSVDAAAEFLRSIQERESQKTLAPLGQQDPIAGAEGSLPTDLSALYPIQLSEEAYQGFPTALQFNDMVNDYLSSLSAKKQAKALLTQQMYDDVLQVLLHPTETKTGSAQFRFWAKKMFKLVSTQVDSRIEHFAIHENKPVAVKEQLYDVLVQCHKQANHGGRDKTAAQVRSRFRCPD
jgi:hypothetical protein